MTSKVTASTHRHGIDHPGFPSYTAKKSTRIIHKGSWRNRLEAGRGVSGTRREERHSFWSPLASDPASLAQTLAIAAETFMNNAGETLGYNFDTTRKR
jgi:hypothetical protein